MNASTDMLDFVKALSNADRLRIIGALSQGSLTTSQVAAQLSLPLRDVINHLSFLAHVGILLVHVADKKQDEIYELDSAFLEQFFRQQLRGTHPVHVPAPDAKETARRDLAAHLNPDGTIRQIPRQAGKLRVILNYLINAFEADKFYTEKEVNVILKHFNEDVSGLRRDLVDAGLLARERDGSRYWRK